jgi:hypothetical protein
MATGRRHYPFSLIIPCSLLKGLLLSFWLLSSLVEDRPRILLNPSLEKRGMGRFYGE